MAQPRGRAGRSARCRARDRCGKGSRRGCAPPCPPPHRSSGRPELKGKVGSRDQRLSGADRGEGARRGIEFIYLPRDSAAWVVWGDWVQMRRVCLGFGAHLVPVDVPHVVVFPHPRGTSGRKTPPALERTRRTRGLIDDKTTALEKVRRIFWPLRPQERTAVKTNSWLSKVTSKQLQVKCK